MSVTYQSQFTASSDEPLEAGKLFRKAGHSSGATEGELNTIQTDITMQDTPNEIYAAMTVVSEPGRPFATPGDSGSIAWDEETQWRGLVFGGQRCGSYSYYSYLIPAHIIEADVKLMTGMDLVPA